MRRDHGRESMEPGDPPPRVGISGAGVSCHGCGTQERPVLEIWTGCCWAWCCFACLEPIVPRLVAAERRGTRRPGWPMPGPLLVACAGGLVVWALAFYGVFALLAR